MLPIYWATFLPSLAPCSSAVRKWMPAHTRASMTSSSASENRSKLRVVHDLLLKALKAILSVPKKFFSVCVNAAVAEAWPEG